MTPKASCSTTEVLDTSQALPSQTMELKPVPTNRQQIVWFNLIGLAYLHATSLVALVLWSHLLHKYTFWFQVFLSFYSGYSVTAGSHRLFAHKSYKARWPLRLLLVIGHTITFQLSLYDWVRTHRVHHKFTDTDADPHNSKRGFFYSQIGWVMLRKHEQVILKGRTIDMSDLEKDWIVMWQLKIFPVLGPLLCFGLPTLIPIYYWGENFWMAWNATALRFLVTLHISGLVNSAAHMWGMKPYDQNMTSSDNRAVAFIAIGEGWHNYHHAFPWDYKAAELGAYGLNWTTAFLDLCAKLGLAYDLKVASTELVKKRVLRTGDGTHTHSLHDHENEVWGWDDKDMDEQDKKLVEIINPEKKN